MNGFSESPAARATNRGIGLRTDPPFQHNTAQTATIIPAGFRRSRYYAPQKLVAGTLRPVFDPCRSKNTQQHGCLRSSRSDSVRAGSVAGLPHTGPCPRMFFFRQPPRPDRTRPMSSSIRRQTNLWSWRTCGRLQALAAGPCRPRHRHHLHRPLDA